MPLVPPQAIPTFLRSLSSSLPSSSPQSATALVSLLAATSLGHGQTWLPHCLKLALDPHPRLAPGVAVPPEPVDHPLLDLDLHPRRFLVAQLKEALVKSASLIGVPRVICALIDLEGALEDPRDLSKAFVRRGLEEGTVAERRQAGRRGLRSVYRSELDGIFDLMHERGLDDLRYLSETTTYGTFLTPHAAPVPRRDASTPPSPDPLAHDPRLLSLVTLACLVPQRSARELHWHLRGAIRRGWTRDEVEQVQGAVEQACEACGVDGVGEGMPRVRDVEVQDEERL
ncbi:hypothetical protein JCM3775_002952 [Rhodotorula graminis]|uniref:Carboxymuconolactone decarboxylase-like domain-containing protein n=1 Tax=Rhodotorula graminis (strain WP1) TaxID=578459 RepID=A0A194S870_RHOGW|nr:uncharacterized protein RHOBADRAFT_52654 [Rhodotorula graminis WP1]KPV76680.1 hypothetical protein RHOBADRAFT_52654 [Rhodotorula graminis WP1]